MELKPNLTGIEEVDALPEALEIAADAASWYDDAGDEIVMQMVADYDVMRRALQMLVVCDLVTTEKLVQAFALARSLR